jgi:hypothetical protein
MHMLVHLPPPCALLCIRTCAEKQRMPDSRLVSAMPASISTAGWQQLADGRGRMCALACHQVPEYPSGPTGSESRPGRTRAIGKNPMA